MEKSISLFHWLPRITCIMTILFISMFAFDAFAPGLSIWQQLRDFLIHLTPSYILIAILLVAWKWEFIGGIIFIIIGLGLSPFVFLLNHNRNHFSVMLSLGVILIINIPFVIVGILFIVNHYKRKS